MIYLIILLLCGCAHLPKDGDIKEASPEVVDLGMGTVSMTFGCEDKSLKPILIYNEQIKTWIHSCR